VVAVWLPWFHRRLSAVFSPVRAERSISGWSALGGLGGLVLVLAAVAVAWGLIGRVPALASTRQPSPFWLVLAGGLALVIEVGITVDRVGAQQADCCAPAVSTTTPAAGLALAFVGAMVVVLAGLTALVTEARRRAR
jgi:hypothetical protein